MPDGSILKHKPGMRSCQREMHFDVECLVEHIFVFRE